MNQRSFNTETVQEVIQFLQKNPGYLKRGKENLASKLGCTVEDIMQAKDLIKTRVEEEIEKVAEEQAKSAEF